MNMKLSVIIPAYNCEKTICRCLNNLLDEQYFECYEIIVVNDGSTDSTKQICENYEKKFPTVRLINKINEGVSSARNTGLANASGEFIAFVDSDDYTEKNFIETVMRKLKDSDELVLFRHDRIDKNNECFDVSKDYSTYGYDKIFKEMVSQKLNTPVKIFRNNIIKKHNLRFNNAISLGEDLEFIMNYYIKIKSVTCWNDILYHYVRTEGSITNRKLTEKDIADFCTAYVSEIAALSEVSESEYMYLLNKSYVRVLFRRVFISKNIFENIKILSRNFDVNSELSNIFKGKYDLKTQIKKYALKILINRKE